MHRLRQRAAPFAATRLIPGRERSHSGTNLLILLSRIIKTVYSLDMKRIFWSLPARRRIGLIAIGIAAPLTLASGVILVNPQFRSQAIAQAEDVLALLEGRSPGERTFAMLTKKSPKASDNVTEGPPPEVERGLGKVFPPEPDGPGLDFITPPELVLLGPGPEPEFTVPITPQGDVAVPSGTSAFGPPGGVFAPPGGFFVPQPPGGNGGPPSPPAAPAVPEPSTWAMLLIGFGLCGAAMRSRRNRKGPLGQARCTPVS